jgi:lysophospholipase L1-like esterase
MIRTKSFIKQLLACAAATVVWFAIMEIAIRFTYFIRNASVDSVPLAYQVGDDYGPVPPWRDGLSIFEPDKTLIWKNRPNVHRRYIDIFSPVRQEEDRTLLYREFIPSIPASFKQNPVWEISLNSQGFRNAEFPTKKSSSTFRIVCIGDSWTFGANVGQDQAYPQQLKAMLRREFSKADIEVFNLGVLGYSTYQGLELLKSRLNSLDPDVVVIGFGMNDSSIGGYRDKDLSRPGNHSTYANELFQLATKMECVKLLRYWAELIKYKPVSVGERMMPQKNSHEEGSALFWKQKYEESEAWVRVSLTDYEKNILEMINLARRRNADVILLNNQLWPENPYTPILKRISKREGVGFVDSLALIDEARRKIEKDLEDRLDLKPLNTLEPAPSGDVEVVFRVYTGDFSVPNGIYIVGPHPKLGKSVPNQVAMYDDGTHGDQIAGDKVWSYTAHFPQATNLAYMYTNSGERGKWEGLDVPYAREFGVKTQNNQERIYTPIDSFGQIYMQADAWHTNAAGYQAIANAVSKILTDSKRISIVRLYEGMRRKQPSH